MEKNIARIMIVLILMLGWFSMMTPQSRLKIVVIPKGTTQLFWQSIQAGAKAAAKASKGVDVIWRAPLTENDLAQQISIMELCIKDGVSGIVLAPLDYKALAEPVSKAMKKRIPVLIFDSGLKGKPGKDFVSFVATNNRKGGNLAGEHFAKILGGKGKVVLMRYMAGQASTTEREEGFLEAITKNINIQLTVKNRFAGGTADDARIASSNIIDKIKEADGIFCPNESSTMGMLLALRQNNLAGKIKFVGFDTSEPLIEALKKGEIDALVAQNPTRMGYYSVKTIVDYIRGETVPPEIDTGVQLITRENLEDPEIQKLLSIPSSAE